MNFQDYKAKYAAQTVSAKTAVETTATKIDAAIKKGAVKTKDVAVKTGTGLAGTLPVTTRKHNAFAAEVNAELNGVKRRLDRHDLLFDVVAEGTGLVLPSNETMDAYLDQQEAEAAREAEATQTPPQEEIIAGVVSKVLASLGLGTSTAVVESVLSPEATAHLDKMREDAPTIAEEEAKETAQADAAAKKEQRRLAALAKKAKEEVEATQQEEVEEEAPVEEEVKEQPAKRIKRKRKAGGMGRQEPLAAE